MQPSFVGEWDGQMFRLFFFFLFSKLPDVHRGAAGWSHSIRRGPANDITQAPRLAHKSRHSQPRVVQSCSHGEKSRSYMGRLGSGDFFIFIICVSIQWGPGSSEWQLKGTDHWGALSRVVYIKWRNHQKVRVVLIDRRGGEEEKKRKKEIKVGLSMMMRVRVPSVFTSPWVVIKCERDFIASAKEMGPEKVAASLLE